MDKLNADCHGAGPLPKGTRASGRLFKKPSRKDEQKEERDMTGQTDTSLKDMKQRLREVPKKSAGSKHDKAAYEKNRG
jgi:hypothetical protein